MRVLILSNGQDTGGQGVRIHEAFERHEPDWSVRSMANNHSYMEYPTDLPRRRRYMDDFYQRCDLIHVRNGFEDYDRLAAKFGPKPVVILFHGTRYRSNPSFWIEEAKKRKATVLVSTLDLWMLNPADSAWLPSIQYLDGI